jgi:hypothetical protein
VANTGKDAAGNTIFIWNPLGASGVDDTNSYPFGNIVGFSRAGSKQHAVIDSGTPANNRGLPVIALAGDGAAPLNTVNGGLIAVPRTPVIVSASYTRPADATAYTLNDSLSNSTSAPSALTFASAVLANSTGGRITRSTLVVSQNGWAGSLRMHLFNGASAPSAVNDNAAFAFQQTNWMGFIDYAGSSNDASGSSYMEGVLSSVGPMDFVAGATTSIFGLCVVKTTFTPASAGTFDFRLWIDQS